MPAVFRNADRANFRVRRNERLVLHRVDVGRREAIVGRVLLGQARGMGRAGIAGSEVHAVGIVRQPRIARGRVGVRKVGAVDGRERLNDQLLGVLLGPILENALGGFAQRDRRELLVDFRVANAVTALVDRHLERAGRHVLFVAFEGAAAGDRALRQLVDESIVHAVARLFRQVLFDLDDRGLVGPHFAGKTVFGEVLGEELRIPLFNSKTRGDARVSHWCLPL